jgi:uncharacterized membrane protein YgcG
MKKIIKIFSILLISFLISTVHAEDRVITYSMKKTPETKERTAENHYGVNKKWQITDKNMPNVMRTHYVDASEKVYDFSDILTDAEEEELKKLLFDFQEKYNTELIILTDSLAYSKDSDNDYYVADFYDYNDFGINNPQYDGIVIFRNTYAPDPYYASVRFGQAQLYIDYNRNESILDAIYPEIHSKSYLAGFKKYISLVTNYYEQGLSNEAKNYSIDENGYITKNKVPNKAAIKVMAFRASMISAVVALIALLVAKGKNKMIIKATKADDYVNKVSYTKKVDQFVRTVTTSYTISSSSGGGGGGGFHSSGGSSGGGFSGGGRHG